jgi:hypothetical protein
VDSDSFGPGCHRSHEVPAAMIQRDFVHRAIGGRPDGLGLNNYATTRFKRARWKTSALFPNVLPPDRCSHHVDRFPLLDG